MERSDKYIEELEAELDEYRGTSRGSSGKNEKYLVNGDADNRKVMSDSKVTMHSDYRTGKESSRRQLFSQEKDDKAATAGERSKYYYDRNGDVKGGHDIRDNYSDYSGDLNPGKSQSAKNGSAGNGKKRVTFDLEKNTNATMSFDLELPSPLKTSGNRSTLSNGRASPMKGVLKKPGGKSGLEDKSLDSYTDLSRTAEDSDIYSAKSAGRTSKDDDLLYMKSSRSRSEERDYKSEDLYSKSKKKYSADDSFLSEPSSFDVKSYSDLEYGSRQSSVRKNEGYDLKSSDYGTQKREVSRSGDSDLTRDDLEDTQCIESELDELNISLTPEFTDCMKLLNRAEKKVHTHDTSDEEDTVSRYKSSQGTDVDHAFRASTGSIGGYRSGMTEDLRASTGSFGYKSGSGTGEDFMSSYKPDSTSAANKFTSSLDSYSRGRHVRSGSLDNLFMDRASGREERPSSALPTTSNMYLSSAQSKYSSGLTTGRTTLTRTPSFDNLLMSRPAMVEYLPRQNLQRIQGGRSYLGETEDNKLDVNANINFGAGSTSVSGKNPVTALHGILGETDTGIDRLRDDRAVTFDSVLQARARSLSDMGSGKSDLDRMLPSQSGRLTPTLASTGTSGRVTPTIPTHSEYLAMPKTSVDKPGYPVTASGRSTPTLTSTASYDSLNKPNTQYSDFKISSTDYMSLKPPTGLRPSDSSNSAPTYTASTLSYTNPAPSKDYSSLPTYSSSSGGGNLENKFDSGPSSAPYSDARYSENLKNDFDLDKYNVGAKASGSIGSSSNQPMYKSDDKFTSLSSYSDHKYIDSEFSSYSSKVPMSSDQLPASIASTNSSSALFTGSSSASSSSYGLGTTYPGSSYQPQSSLASVPSGSSYSTALSVPLTYTTTSYTSSAPSSSYPSKPLDPIAESNHYSYVSNASGDFSSKNDTFALPEPKKRLFDDSDDLNMSVSPIKANRRY